MTQTLVETRAFIAVMLVSGVIAMIFGFVELGTDSGPASAALSFLIAASFFIVAAISLWRRSAHRHSN
ncbi:hypothetical protein HK107_07270 [Parvularcula sp. ZS-1/3]|uniref:Uncharacterized protein n=1 Tax=Parvularcula mediterranea TaxID=2732508 RepID=A0A7Y3RLC0_9PROT|nr:hypothetical protein [Parvularcula mediterranea]NNU16120.1 hypothetical protein [Parvularcula mediterranea]